MQEFKGTPGPWFRDNGRAIGPKSAEDDQSYGMVIPVGWVEFDPEIEVQVANQQMMAAAPELMEALQLALNAMNEMGDILNFHDLAEQSKVDELTPAFDKARAAIAKALGK
ncbi:TPA: hypothetical protein MBF34_004864 [Klebsiella aerogenes]|nr:hypothetical protein [Klebsiella aerogenes]